MSLVHYTTLSHQNLVQRLSVPLVWLSTEYLLVRAIPWPTSPDEGADWTAGRYSFPRSLLDACDTGGVP